MNRFREGRQPATDEEAFTSEKAPPFFLFFSLSSFLPDYEIDSSQTYESRWRGGSGGRKREASLVFFFFYLIEKEREIQQWHVLLLAGEEDLRIYLFC